MKVEDGLPEYKVGEQNKYLCICEGRPYVLSLSEGGRLYMDFKMKNYFEDWTEYVTLYQPITPPQD